ncbi:MAG: hypothetical protein ACOX1A_03535 [Saccharofermentanales bacterium]
MKKLIQSLALFVALLVLLSTVACTSPDTIKIGGADDLKGKTIGVQSGTTGDILAGSEDVAAGRVERFNQYVDVISAFKTTQGGLCNHGCGHGKRVFKRQ